MSNNLVVGLETTRNAVCRLLTTYNRDSMRQFLSHTRIENIRYNHLMQK